MPTFEGKVVDAVQTWQSPDGQRTLYEITVDINGQHGKLKTWSKVIAVKGWQGQIETYEKANNRGGMETFAKQPQREGFAPRGQTSLPAPRSSGGRQDSNPYTMYLSYAKDLLVALIVSKEYSEDLYQKLLDEAARGGDYLFNHKVAEPQDEAVLEPDKNELNNVFGDDIEAATGGGIPWVQDK